MPNSNTGVDFTTMTNVILQYGHYVLRTPITKTTGNVEGDETLTVGTPEVITAYISRKNATWYFDKAGLIAGGDALMVVTAGQTINKDDTIGYDGTTYRVQDVIARDQIGGITAFKSCNLFKI
jgi:hypothetical protein